MSDTYWIQQAISRMREGGDKDGASLADAEVASLKAHGDAQQRWAHQWRDEADALKARLAEAEKDAALDREIAQRNRDAVHELTERLAKAERNAERLKIRCETYTEAYGVALRATHQSHRGHWDEKGTHGANCPECIRAQEARDNCQAIIKRGLDRLIDAARAADSEDASHE